MGYPMAERRPRIFISYRREDCAVHAGRLADNLTDRLDAEVFLDVDSIPPGADFVEFLEHEVGACDVMMVMIGDDWLELSGREGCPRLADPLDFVHIEIRSALERKVPVIPVLVEGSKMPLQHQLPEPLAKLSRRQAIMLRDESWRQDVETLVRRMPLPDRSESSRPHPHSASPESEGNQQLQRARKRAGTVRNADTVIVAARHARIDYEVFGTYICQPNRSFREGIRYLGFYTQKRIDSAFPAIVERRRAVPFTRETVERLGSSANERDVQVARIIEQVVGRVGDGRKEGEQYQIFLLDDQAGFRLAAPIQHVGSSAWSQSQRYTSSEALKSAPQTTEELASRGG